MNWLYEEADIYLKRKFDIFNNYKENYYKNKKIYDKNSL